MRGKISIKSNLLLNLTFTLAFLAVGSASKAATLKLLISTNQGIDPENGTDTYTIENPSGEVDVTFLREGLQFVYTNKQGVVVTRKTFADFRKKEVDSEDGDFRRRFEKFKYQASKDRGVQIARGFLGQLSEFSAQKGVPVIVYFNPKGQLGFAKTDYVFSNVSAFVVGSGQGPISFEDAVYSLLRPEITNAVIESLKAETPRKNPIGFTSDATAMVAALAESAKVGGEGQCAALFN